MSPVYWSLAYEFVFYLIVGLTFSSLINREIEFTVLAVAFIAAMSFYAYSIFDVRILEFAVGILLMRVVVDKDQRTRIGMWIIVFLAIVFWTGGAKIGGAVLLAASAIFFLREVQFGQWAYFLGGISYSLYLTHVIVGGRVINFGKRFGEGALYEVMLIAVALSLSLLFAVLFARYIEGPATRASRSIA